MEIWSIGNGVEWNGRSNGKWTVEMDNTVAVGLCELLDSLYYIFGRYFWYIDV